MRLSREDQRKLEKIYTESVLKEDMTAGELFGGITELEPSLVNQDNYAPKDTRIPKVLGKTQTRRGALGKNRKKKLKKVKKRRG